MSRTAIIGTGVTGLSCARYLSGADELVVLDTRPEISGASAFDGLVDDLRLGVECFDFTGFQRVVVSPGVSLDACLVRQARDAGAELVSDMDLFFAAAQAPIYAVTGTNGKSTVTSLAAELLQANGVRAAAGGNLGDAALDVLSEDVDAYVMELSSFQLERMRAHPKAAAVILNISDDHLDRHGTLARYAEAKQRIYTNARVTVSNRAQALTSPTSAGEQHVTFGLDEAPDADSWGLIWLDGESWFARGDEAVLPTSEMQLPGSHNHANFLAACALLALDFEIALEPLRKVAGAYAGLPHRCVLVRELDGVRYINDSKATNVGATIAAVEGLLPAGRSERIVLIAGGDGKGADFSPLLEVRDRLRAVVTTGQDGPLIAETMGTLAAAAAPDMVSAVRAARGLARPGDLVLLSPACASLDQYPNYMARGDAFEQAVKELDA